MSQAERGAVASALNPAIKFARGALELGLVLVTGPPGPLPLGAGRWGRGVDHALGERRLIGLLGGLVAVVGLLVGVLS